MYKGKFANDTQRQIAELKAIVAEMFACLDNAVEETRNGKPISEGTFYRASVAVREYKETEFFQQSKGENT